MRTLIKFLAVWMIVTGMTGCNLVSGLLFKAETELAQPTQLILPANGTTKHKPDEKVLLVEMAGNSTLNVHYENQPVETVRIQQLGEKLEKGKKEHREKFFVVVKPNQAVYKDLIDVLDQLTIHEVTRYSMEK